MIPASGITRQDMHALVHYIVQLPSRNSDLERTVVTLNDCEPPWHSGERNEETVVDLCEASQTPRGNAAFRKSSRPRERVLRLSERWNASNQPAKSRYSDIHGTSTEPSLGNGRGLSHPCREENIRISSPEQVEISQMTASELDESTYDHGRTYPHKEEDIRIIAPEQAKVRHMTASEIVENINGRGLTHQHKEENIRAIAPKQMEVSRMTTSELEENTNGRGLTHQQKEEGIRTIAPEQVKVGHDTLSRDDGASESEIVVPRDASPRRFNVTSRATRSSREPRHGSSNGSRRRFNVTSRSTRSARDPRLGSSDATPRRFNVTSRSARSSREPRHGSSDGSRRRFNVTSRIDRNSWEPRHESSDATPRRFNVTSRSARSSREPRHGSSDGSRRRFNVTSRIGRKSREPRHGSSDATPRCFNVTSRSARRSREPRHGSSDATPRRFNVTSRTTCNSREPRYRSSGASSLSSRRDASPCIFNIHPRRSSFTSSWSSSQASLSSSSSSSSSASSSSTFASDVCFNIYQHPRASTSAHSIVNGSDESIDASYADHGRLRDADEPEEGHGENNIRRVPTPLASSHGSLLHTVTTSPAHSRRPHLITTRHGQRRARRDKNADNFSFKPSLDLTKHKNEELLGEGRVFRSVEERLAYMGRSYAKRRAKMQSARKEEERKVQGDGFRVAGKSEWYCQVARRPALALRTIGDCEKKRDTLEKARKEKDELEMEECVFRPDLCPRSRKMMNSSPALLCDFAERQCEWKKRKDEKLRKVLEKDTMQKDAFSFHPVISKVSRQLSSKWQRSPLDSKRSVRSLIAQKRSAPSRNATSVSERGGRGEGVEQTHAAACDSASCGSDQGVRVAPGSKWIRDGGGPSQGRPNRAHNNGVNGGSSGSIGDFSCPSRGRREVRAPHGAHNSGDRTISFDAFVQRTDRRKKNTTAAGGAPAPQRKDAIHTSPKPSCDESMAERRHKTSRARAPNGARGRAAVSARPDACGRKATEETDEELRAAAMPINEVVYDTSLAGILDMVESAARDAAF